MSSDNNNNYLLNSSEDAEITSSTTHQTLSIHRESFYFPNIHENYELYGILTNRRTHTVSNNEKQAIIIVHGMLAHSTWGFIPFLNDYLLNELPHISAIFRFDCSGDGKSGANWSYSGYNRKVKDLESAIQLLTNKPYNYNINTLIGHSLGGDVVLLYSAQHIGLIPNIVNICGRYDMSRTIKWSESQRKSLEETGSCPFRFKNHTEIYQITKEMVQERENLNLTIYLKQIAAPIESKQQNNGDTDSTIIDKSKAKKPEYRVRTLTVHAINDESIPVSDAYAFHEHIANHTLKILNDGGHLFENLEHRTELAQTISTWLFNNNVTDQMKQRKPKF